MENTQDSWIDVEGTLKNLNNYGFTILDCIGEELDNSISAGATLIGFTVNTLTNEVIFTDNGKGMTEDGLVAANVFNKRTVSTNSKHGRFGAGAKFYNSKISEGKGVVLQVSKTFDSPRINQIAFDYDKFIQKNNITLFAHQATSDTEKLWARSAIAPDKSGTLKHIAGTPAVVNELREMIESKDISNSLAYRIGCNYCKEIIEKEILIVIKLVSEKGDHVQRVIPLDPMCWNPIDAKHKLETRIQVYQNTKTNTLVGVFNDGNKSIYREKNVKTKRYNTTPFENNGLEFKPVGDITVQSSYSGNWENLQRADVEKLGCVVNTGAGIQNFRKNSGGKYIERNHKKIARFEVLKPTSGDTWRYQYSENVRHNIVFSASLEMDELFGVGVNKNDIREETINKQIWEDAIGFVCEMLPKKLCKMYEPKPPTPKPPNPTPTPPSNPSPNPTPTPPSNPSPNPTPTPPSNPSPTPPSNPSPTPPSNPSPTPPSNPSPNPPNPTPTPPSNPTPTPPSNPTPTPPSNPTPQPVPDKQIRVKLWSDACKIIMDKIASGDFDKSMEECNKFMKFAKDL